MLKSENRLTKRKEFSYVYKKGKKTSSPFVSLVYVSTKLKVSRIGFSISKKIGKAHTRNLIKRRLREIFFIELPKLKTNNYVIVANKGIEELTYQQLKNEVLIVLNRENLYHE